tara:strand:- start:708 stop:971 length:264 start_codon:yes stop_codon:yes gene_type:complete
MNETPANYKTIRAAALARIKTARIQEVEDEESTAKANTISMLLHYEIGKGNTINEAFETVFPTLDFDNFIGDLYDCLNNVVSRDVLS